MLLTRDYTYSKVGDINEKSTEHGLYSYLYDSKSQLTWAENPTQENELFSYDDLGNRETHGLLGTTLTYNLNNELIDRGGDTLDYDLNGNMIANSAFLPEQQYGYDVTGRLNRIDTVDNTVHYGYDPFGRRLWKDVDGVRTYFLYADEGLIGEYDAAGNELRSYGYQAGSSWGSNPLYQKTGGEYYWYLNDHLGTPQQLVDSVDSVVWTAEYDSFGKAQLGVNTISNNLGFPGQYYDEESGLYYNWHRYYDPLLGRYLRADPLGLDAGLNFYVYVGNNPLGYVDWDGLAARAAGRMTWEGTRRLGNTINNNLLQPANKILHAPSDLGQFALQSTVSFVDSFISPSDQVGLAQSTPYPADDVMVAAASVVRYGSKLGKVASNAKKTDFYVTPGGQTIPSQGYRALGGESNINEALSGKISSRNPTYITFDNLRGKGSTEVQNLLQLPKKPSHAVQFDTLQLVDDLSIPTGKWNTTNTPEPITNTFSKWGKGGGTQAITNEPINVDDFWRLGE